MSRLKAGLLGLGRGGRALARVLLRSSWCELICVASDRPDRLQAFAAAHPEVTTYNDHRLGVVGRPLDVLFVATPPFQRADYLRMAAERGIAVWMLSPPLHRYDQLLPVVECFERAGVPIAAARMWGGESVLCPAAIGIEQMGPILLAQAYVSTRWSGELLWRGDAARAGGGALLEGGYLMLDALVQLLGVPATVLAVTARTPPTGPRAVYDTEDNAVLVCRYSDGPIAVLTASRRIGPDEQALHIAAQDGSVVISDEQVVVRDAGGHGELLRLRRPADRLGGQVEEFLGALATQPRKPPSHLRDHLPTMAVVQAAYLSARTGHPETPAVISSLHRLG